MKLDELKMIVRCPSSPSETVSVLVIHESKKDIKQPNWCCVHWIETHVLLCLIFTHSSLRMYLQGNFRWSCHVKGHVGKTTRCLSINIHYLSWYYLYVSLNIFFSHNEILLPYIATCQTLRPGDHSCWSLFRSNPIRCLGARPMD